MELSKPRPSTLAWGVLIGSVAAYDVLCPKSETISERLDPILERPLGRTLLYGAVGTTALHLCNLIPEKIDPFSRLLSFKDSRPSDLSVQ